MKFKAYMVTKEGNKFSKIFNSINKYDNFRTFFEMKVEHVIKSHQ